jgi:hypothetical protein
VLDDGRKINQVVARGNYGAGYYATLITMRRSANRFRVRTVSHTPQTPAAVTAPTGLPNVGSATAPAIQSSRF